MKYRCPFVREQHFVLPNRSDEFCQGHLSILSMCTRQKTFQLFFSGTRTWKPVSDLPLWLSRETTILFSGKTDGTRLEYSCVLLPEAHTSRWCPTRSANTSRKKGTPENLTYGASRKTAVGQQTTATKEASLNTSTRGQLLDSSKLVRTCFVRINQNSAPAPVRGVFTVSYFSLGQDISNWLGVREKRVGIDPGGVRGSLTGSLIVAAQNITVHQQIRLLPV